MLPVERIFSHYSEAEVQAPGSKTKKDMHTK